MLFGPTSLLVLLALAPLCSACTNVSGSTSGAPHVQQLIVKFKPSTVTCDAAGVARVSSLSRYRFELVRPMSGDACVILQLANDPADFARGLAAIATLPFVEWAEPDTPMKAL